MTHTYKPAITFFLKYDLMASDPSKKDDLFRFRLVTTTMFGPPDQSAAHCKPAGEYTIRSPLSMAEVKGSPS